MNKNNYIFVFIAFLGGVMIAFTYLVMFILGLKKGYLNLEETILFGNTAFSFIVYIGCSFIVGGFLFVISKMIFQYIFFKKVLFNSKEESKKHKEYIYNKYFYLRFIKKCFPKYYESLEVDYYEKRFDIIKKIFKYLRALLITFIVLLPFYYLSFNNYFYSTNDHFYYNSFFRFQEEKLNLNDIKKIQIKILLSKGNDPSINFSYWIIFQDGRKFELSESEIVELAEFDNVLKLKGITRDYLSVDDRVFSFIRNNNDEEYVESIKSIFSDYDNVKFK